nr:MAG TPA: hypothetical protein [Caudoviricetes sp.]
MNLVGLCFAFLILLYVIFLKWLSLNACKLDMLKLI